MNQRSLLRRQISQAWQKAIEINYSGQRINSERSLQAAVWSELNEMFMDTARRLFIEPTIVTNTSGSDGTTSKNKRTPDIVICNSREIIAVLELKYQPRAKPTYKKDLETLALISKARDEVAISNNRFRGIKSDARTYKLSSSVLYVWAGIHSDAHVLICPPEEISSSFLELHAITTDEGKLNFRRGRCCASDV